MTRKARVSWTGVEQIFLASELLKEYTAANNRLKDGIPPNAKLPINGIQYCIGRLPEDRRRDIVKEDNIPWFRQLYNQLAAEKIALAKEQAVEKTPAPVVEVPTTPGLLINPSPIVSAISEALSPVISQILAEAIDAAMSKIEADIPRLVAERMQQKKEVSPVVGVGVGELSSWIQSKGPALPAAPIPFGMVAANPSKPARKRVLVVGTFPKEKQRLTSEYGELLKLDIVPAENKNEILQKLSGLASWDAIFLVKSSVSHAAQSNVKNSSHKEKLVVVNNMHQLEDALTFMACG